MTPCEEERALQRRGDVRTLAEYLAAIAEHLNGATYCCRAPVSTLPTTLF